jgi:hypothetical protein
MLACPFCPETFEGDDAGDKYADHLTFDHDAYTRLATIEADVESAGVGE